MYFCSYSYILFTMNFSSYFLHLWNEIFISIYFIFYFLFSHVFLILFYYLSLFSFFFPGSYTPVQFFIFYSIMSSSVIFFNFLRYLMYAIAGIRTSRILHDSLLKAILGKLYNKKIILLIIIYIYIFLYNFDKYR